MKLKAQAKASKLYFIGQTLIKYIKYNKGKRELDSEKFKMSKPSRKLVRFLRSSEDEKSKE